MYLILIPSDMKPDLRTLISHVYPPHQVDFENMDEVLPTYVLFSINNARYNSNCCDCNDSIRFFFCKSIRSWLT